MGDTPLRLGFLMFPGFPMACLTSAIEPLRAANEIKELHCSRIDAVKPMTKPRDDFSSPSDETVQLGFDSILFAVTGVCALSDGLIKLHALLTRPTVNIV